MIGPEDITRRIMDAETRLDRIIEQSGHAVLVADETGIIIRANAAAHTLLAATQPLVGRPITSIMPERYRERHLRGFAQYLQTRRPTLIGKVVKVHALRDDGIEQSIVLTLASSHIGDQEQFIAVMSHDVMADVR